MDEQIIKKVCFTSREYFLKNRYQESCGIVLSASNKFLPIKNENPSSWSFSLNTRIHLIKKKIQAIVHSHPFGDSHPSPRDIKTSLSVGIPFLVYSCLYDNFVFFDLEKCKPYKV
jgi:proteasome lid subunit RPN8/RPN11